MAALLFDTHTHTLFRILSESLFFSRYTQRDHSKTTNDQKENMTENIGKMLHKTTYKSSDDKLGKYRSKKKIQLEAKIKLIKKL